MGKSSRDLFSGLIQEGFRDLTVFGSMILYMAAVLLFILLRMLDLALGMLYSVAVLLAVAVAVRLIYFKKRPEDRGKKVEYDSIIYRIDRSSFPSVHSARAAILAVALFMVTELNSVRALGVLLAAGAVLSRVVLKKHSIEDAVAGALIGTAIGLFFFRWI